MVIKEAIPKQVGEGKNHNYLLSKQVLFFLALSLLVIL